MDTASVGPERTLDRVNAWLDALPRVDFFSRGRARPAWRAAGIAGFHVALVVAIAAALLTGRSLRVVALLSVACAASFFAWAWLRMRLTGRENIVLLEHVWAADLAAVGTLLALGEPVLAYLDIVSVALGAFLAIGRLGCVMAGCCHGEPSSVGIVYGDDAVRGGFPAALARVRLFPVPLVESAGLAVITLAGLAALSWARAGGVTVWFLASYAVLRIGTEGLRGDVRPHWLGLSAPRWMALADLAVALALDARLRGESVDLRTVIAWGVLAATLVITLVRLARGDRRRLLHPNTLAAIRATARELAETGPPGEAPRVASLPNGLTVAASRADARGALHVSLARAGRADWPLLAHVAAAAFPEASAERCAAGTRALHLRLDSLPAEPPVDNEPRGRRALALLGATVREPVTSEASAGGNPSSPMSAGGQSPSQAAPATAGPRDAVVARVMRSRATPPRSVRAPRVDYFRAPVIQEDLAGATPNEAANGASPERPDVGS